jgi:hypothetical protein
VNFTPPKLVGEISRFPFFFTERTGFISGRKSGRKKWGDDFFREEVMGR